MTMTVEEAMESARKWSDKGTVAWTLAAEVERLLGENSQLLGDMALLRQQQNAEVERLRSVNARLVEALETILEQTESQAEWRVAKVARDALADSRRAT